MVYPNKQAARQALSGAMQKAANRFFRDATANAQDFKITPSSSNTYTMEFFSPAKNAGYGKRYVQEIDSTGDAIREYKETLAPEGLIETKWIHGGSR